MATATAKQTTTPPTLDDYLADIHTQRIDHEFQQYYKNVKTTSATGQRIKILSMGDSGVGKSCLIKRYCEGKFIARYICTIGIDFGVRSVYVNRDTYQVVNKSDVTNADNVLEVFLVNLFDVAGSDEYLAIRNEFHVDTQGIILVLDLTNRASFQHLQQWLDEHQRYNTTTYDKAMKNVVVLGNKGDEPNIKRQVKESEVMEWCAARQYKYFETSANSGVNVVEAFEALFKMVLQSSNAR